MDTLKDPGRYQNVHKSDSKLFDMNGKISNEGDYPQLLTLFKAGDIIFNLFNGNSYVIIVANDGTIVRTWDIPQLPFGLKPNTPIPEGTVTYKTLTTKKRCTSIMSKENSRFGFGYVGIGVPVFNNDEFLGVLTITSPLHQQDIVMEISKELQNDIQISNENKKNISNISDEIMNIVNKLLQITTNIQQNIGVIADVTSLIQNVSGQTNLLGLNAAIESAKAGDAGKGFAVVAHEIRRLSDTVKDSVKELNSKLKLLNEIIEDINPQVANLNSQVSKQTMSINEISEITNRLERASERLGSLAQESWM